MELIIRYRLFHMLVQMLHLANGLVHRLRNILRFSKVGGIHRSRNTSLSSKSTSHKQKININGCDKQCHYCFVRIKLLSINPDCFIRVY